MQFTEKVVVAIEILVPIKMMELSCRNRGDILAAIEDLRNITSENEENNLNWDEFASGKSNGELLKFVEMIACLSFAEGGITVFDRHFEGKLIEE